MRYDKDKLRESLSVDDIKVILSDLGSSEPQEDNNGNPMFQTVCHSGGSHKLYYYSETKKFHCYTQCSATFNIYDLVMKVKDISFPQAVRYVARVSGKTFGFGSNIEEKSDDLIDDWNWLNKLKKKEKKIIELPEYDKTVLDVLLPYPFEDWINEGITYEAQEKFGIGYYVSDNRVSIPHYDLNNRLIGIRGRSTRQEDIDAGRKYLPLTIENKLYSHGTTFNLYALNQNKKTISRMKKILLFEGEKSVMKVDSIYPNSNFTVATCSSQITNYQRDLILSLGVEEVIIGFDKFRSQKDNETNEMYEKQIEVYQERLLKFAHKFSPFTKVSIIWDDFDLLEPKMSPIDAGEEVLLQLMKTKYEIGTKSESEDNE